MSESAYYAKEFARFRAEHPSEDGWGLYEVSPFDYLGLRGLPEFLKDCAPQTHKKLDIVRCVMRSIEQQVNPAGRVGIKEWNWRGKIEVQWCGEPIHFRSVTVISAGTPHCETILVATKSLSTFEDIVRSLARYRTAKRIRKQIAEKIKLTIKTGRHRRMKPI